MVEPSKEQLERMLASMRRESKNDHRQLERFGGVALVIMSLVMAAVFLFALMYSANNTSMIVMSVFFLVVSVALFSRGLRDAIFGKSKKTGGH